MIMPLDIMYAYEPPTIQEQVHEIVLERGYNEKQWDCISEIIWRESRWHLTADNPESSAYGLGQILNSEKFGNEIAVQMDHMIRYIDSRYDDSCDALDHHNKYHWY